MDTEALQAIAQDHRVRRLDLFGSAARGKAAPHDYDFLVEFEPMPPLEHGRHYFALLEDLQQVLNAPVDLIETEAVRNPYFLQEVERERVLIYAV